MKSPVFHFRKNRLLLLIAVLLCASQLASAQIPSFPGAEGYGAYAAGGRGGDVYHVTNLNSSGAGSFFDAIATVPTAGRTIVFDVSGYIRLPSGSSGTRMTASKVTIAGQTAPGDGIGFYNNFFRISGDDIVIRHLRFRHGKYGSGGDCIDLDSGCLNAMLDHVSMEFSTDENISSYSSPPENLTLQYSLNSWGLESHSCGGLWDQNHATSHHNLWSHNHTRNPKARPNGLLEWINNVTFDWDIGFIMGDSYTPSSWKTNVINNYFICPPGNIRTYALEKGWLDRNSPRHPTFSIYLSGNLMDRDGDGTLNGVAIGYERVEGSEFNSSEVVPAYVEGDNTANDIPRYYKNATPFTSSTAGVITDAPLLAYKKIVSNAGALRMDASYTGTLRDEVDTILVSKLTTRTAFHVTRESDTGASASGFGTLNSTAAPIDTDKDGMPDRYENALGWSSAVQDHNTTVSGTTFFPAGTPSGYTRLEEYLHFLAVPHLSILKGTATTPDIDLTRYTAGFSNAPVFTISSITGGTLTQSGSGGRLVHFAAQATAGRGGFTFTVTDAEGSVWAQRFAICVTNSDQLSDLTWQGDGATNIWNTSSNLWLKSGTLTAFSNGDRVTFGDSGSKSPAVSLPGAVTVATMDVETTGTYTFTGGGSISSGSNNLTKRGTGALVLSNTGGNSFGKVLLEEGALVLNHATAAGSGKIALNGGSLTLAPASNASLANPLEFNANTMVTIGSQHTTSGTWSGLKTVTVNGTSSYLWTPSMPWSAFTGRIVFGTGNVKMRLNSTSNLNYGSTAVAVDLGSGSAQFMNRNGDAATAFDIGSLESTGTATQLSGAQSTTVASTYSIGALNTDTTFAGTIINGGTGGVPGLTHIKKVGAGTWTLTGVSSYTGTTTVSSGSLIVAGTLGNTPVTVASGAFLGGGGRIGGTVACNSGAILSPGTVPFTGATMTVGNGLSLNGSTLYYDMSNSPAGANDKIVMSGGVLTMSGTQYFQFLLLNGTLGMGTYTLVTGGTNTSAAGAALSHNLPADTRQAFSLERPASGNGQCYVQLVVSGTAPASLVWTGTGGGGGIWDTQTTSSWSGGPTATFFSLDSVTFDNTSANGSVNINGNVAPRALTVNNTTTPYIFGGTGSIGGSTSLVKSGTGVLTITGSNTYTGGTFINGGTIILANDTANAFGLGTGAITFNGGTLTMYDNDGTYNGQTYNLVVPAGQSGTFNSDSRCDLYGALTGSGTLNMRVTWVRTSLFGDWSAFAGRINVTADSDGGDLRMATSYNFPGFPNAAVNLADKVYLYFSGSLSGGAGSTISIGELSGSSLSVLLGSGTSADPRLLTYRIGGKDTDAVFAGTIREQNATESTTGFVKTGAGIWTLSGSCAWNGGTTIEEGTLRISGTVTSVGAVNVQPGSQLSLLGGRLTTDAVNVSGSATLSGSGAIVGDLNNDGTLSCTGGVVTVTGNAVNNGTMRFTGGGGIAVSGSTNTFVNNGLLDLLTGLQSLPANFENHGTVLDSSDVAVTSLSMTGTTFSVSIAGFTGHNYQLQHRASLTSGTWENVESVQAGSNGATLTFNHTGAVGSQAFFRIVISP